MQYRRWGLNTGVREMSNESILEPLFVEGTISLSELDYECPECGLIMRESAIDYIFCPACFKKFLMQHVPLMKQIKEKKDENN